MSNSTKLFISLQTAEICDFVCFLNADDVFGFDVPVYQIFGVDGHQCFGDVESDVDELVEGEVCGHGHAFS